MCSSHATSTSLRLADVFVPELVSIGVHARGRDDVIGELVHRLVSTGRIDSSDEPSLVQMVLAREQMGATALGNGIAFPHCRSNLTETFVGAVAIEPAGMDFQALDRQPVYVVFLLIGPLDRREQHFDLLGRIVAIGKDKRVRLQLRGCGTPDEVIRVLEEVDSGSASMS